MVTPGAEDEVDGYEAGNLVDYIRLYGGVSSGYEYQMTNREIVLAYIWKALLCVLNTEDKSSCMGKLRFGIFIGVIDSPVLQIGIG